jgi:hypothetical protein
MVDIAQEIQGTGLNMSIILFDYRQMSTFFSPELFFKLF